jgi:hypothetical protein
VGPVKIAAACLLAAAAGVGVFLLARGGSSESVDPTAPVAVRAAFDSTAIAFGDPVAARVVVALDRDAVKPETLRVDDSLAPFTALSAPKTTRQVAGRLETVTIRQRIACLTEACLARTIKLPRTHVTVQARDGSTATASAHWRPVHLRSRVTSSDLERSTPRLAADTTPPPVDERISSTPFEILAALAAAGAVALLAFAAAARTRRRRAPVDGDELARALRLVREAEERPAPDRRRAVGLLARLLHGDNRRTANDLAWSRPTPEAPAVDALVTDVERERSA